MLLKTIFLILNNFLTLKICIFEINVLTLQKNKKIESIISMNKLLIYEQRTIDIDDNLIYKKPAICQECFVRDVIGGLLHTPIFVISHHRSKSISLPVYGFRMRNGIKVIMRNNFYNWKVSIELPTIALDKNYLDIDLFSDGVNANINSCYCEGFKEEWVYGRYESNSDNCLKFTVELLNDYKLYMMLFLLNKFNTQQDIVYDKKSVEEITESIKNIHKENGLDETSYFLNTWEILHYTFNEVDKINIREYKNYMTQFEIKDPKVFAEYICRYPKAEEEFLKEEALFKMNF